MEKDQRRASRSGLLIEVRYEGAGVRAQTRISDISVTGVFVETLSPPPVGAVVKMSFSLPDGRTVEAEGVVKHIQPGIGMGIEFSSLKSEDEEFIRSLG
ncbi:MAG TPA: PilZ domain-containing protein [Blastocatellia bacterium]|nr:PilZ domain-containing protein [Blastocatellia bacterium]